MTDFDQIRAQDTVYALAAAPDGVHFAARASGLYRSTDSGATWQFAYDSLKPEQPLTTTALACAPDGSVFAGVNGGVLRSSDGGLTWYAAAFSAPPPLVTALVVSPGFEQDGVILAGTAEDGIFSSTDRGHYWTPWNFGLIDLNVFSLTLSPDFARDQTAYVGTETGIFRSTNGGRAWRSLPFPIDSAPVLSLAVLPRDPNVLFAGTETSGLYTSPDRGKTWARIAEDQADGAVSALVAQADRLWALLDDRVLVSADSGQSWQTLGAGALADQTALALCVHEGAALAGCAAGAIVRVG